jgi:hypothetical protein
MMFIKKVHFGVNSLSCLGVNNPLNNSELEVTKNGKFTEMTAVFV